MSWSRHQSASAVGTTGNSLPTQRERATAVAAHLAWFGLPVLGPALVWALGRAIGSPYLHRHGAAVTNAHLSAVGLASITWGLAWLSGTGPLSDGAPGVIGGLVTTLGFITSVLLIVVLLSRGLEAILGAAAAWRGDLRPYLLTARWLR